MSEGAHLTDADAEHRRPNEDAPESDTGDESLDRSSDGEPTHDALFDALSNQRRRFVLHCLKQRDDGEVELADLSAQVTAWEQGGEADALSYAERKNVHTSLSQFHLPKLEDLGFVTFDADRGTVRLTDRAESVDIYLETVSGRDLPWGTVLLVLSSSLSAVVLGSLLNVWPLGGLSHQSLAVFVAVTFLSSSAFCAHDTWTRMRVGVDGPPPEVER